MPRPLAHAPFCEDQQMQRDVSCVCRLLPLIIVPSPPTALLFCFAFWQQRKQNTCVANLLRNLGHAHRAARQRRQRGATAHAVTRKKSFECSPGQTSLPASAPLSLSLSLSRLGLQPDWKQAEWSGERGSGGCKANSSHTKLWQLR